MEKSMKRCTAFAISLTVMCFQTIATSSGWSQSLCSPKTNTARILTRAAPNAIHPDWRGDNFVGTGWTLTPKRTVTNLTGTYAIGDLHSGSTGGIVNRNVFVLLSEWDCSGSLSQEPIASVGEAPMAAPSAVRMAPDVVSVRSPEDIFGTWESVGNHCSASPLNNQGDYFRLAQGSYQRGDKSECEDPAPMTLSGDGSTEVAVDTKCTVSGHGVLIPIQRRFKISQSMLFNYQDGKVVGRYERCESVRNSFAAQLPTDFEVLSAGRRVYRLKVADWGQILEVGQARIAPTVIGTNDGGSEFHNRVVQRRIVHTSRFALGSFLEFGFRILVPPIESGDRVTFDTYRILENNSCGLSIPGKDVIHHTFDSTMSGEWYFSNTLKSDEQCVGGYRQVIVANNYEIVSRTMEVFRENLTPTSGALLANEARVQPSFNCNAGNLNDAERTVCGNAELSQADANMSSTYNRIFAERKGSTSLRDEQRAFLKRRDACGVDVACLKTAYWERFNDLAWLNGQGHEDR
jgi:uncharacterized protein YecT (DUF1311 family)